MMDLDPSLTIFIWTPCTLQMYNLCSVVLEISGGSSYLEPDHAAASVNIIECVVYFVGAETIIMVSYVSPDAGHKDKLQWHTSHPQQQVTLPSSNKNF